MARMGPGRVVGPGSPTFELHSLGWRAFQDLCMAVMRTELGQEVHAFADSNDGGRDGAFYGTWHNPPSGADRIDGQFVLQCKHSKKADATLSASGLNDEFAKIHPLVQRGLCQSYLLLTSARVTGNAEEKICERLRGAGVEHPLILDGQWLCDTIAKNRELRRLVPRVYGLGDLSQVLDERAYIQTSALLSGSRDLVTTFVITDPYRRAAEALSRHGFVLLLGEPAAGKTAIARMLALVAADNWDCPTVKVRTASELVSHWNPHEPGQLFWVDDAFGTVRHSQQCTEDWGRSMEHVMSAISHGAKVVLTSRSYIYEHARHLLKESAYPRLSEQQIRVDVADLSLDERRQILYNHITLGDQPAEVKAKIKPFLDHVAVAEPFRPEMARRLGRRTFTEGLSFTKSGVTEFMTRDRQFLNEIYDQLNPDQQGALALVYATSATGCLGNPLQLTQGQLDIISWAGGTLAGAAKALGALTGDFLQLTGPPLARQGWAFRHPTLWEGFAAWLAGQPLLLPVVLDGLSDSALLDRTDCLDATEAERGILLRVPPALYGATARRLAGIRQLLDSGQRYIQEDGRQVDLDDSTHGSERDRRKGEFLYFLGSSCSAAFLREYLKADPSLPGHLADLKSYVPDGPDLILLARFHEAGLLEEQLRIQTVERLADLVTTPPDVNWLSDWAMADLLTPGDRTRLLERVRDELVPELCSDNGWFGRETRSSVYDPVEEVLSGYRDAFASSGDHETAQVLGEALDKHLQRPVTYDDDPFDGWSPRSLVPEPLEPPPHTSRSIFDDIDEE
jgi:hypothetical protein